MSQYINRDRWQYFVARNTQPTFSLSDLIRFDRLQVVIVLSHIDERFRRRRAFQQVACCNCRALEDGIQRRGQRKITAHGCITRHE